MEQQKFKCKKCGAEMPDDVEAALNKALPEILKDIKEKNLDLTAQVSVDYLCMTCMPPDLGKGPQYHSVRVEPKPVLH